MSWNKHAYNGTYHREDKFDYLEWKSQDDQDRSWWDDWSWSHDSVMAWEDYGSPKSMTELAQYRLLTLLRRMHIKTAINVIDRIGWF